jgi:C-terminal processing protease CtpA/Prc
MDANASAGPLGAVLAAVPAEDAPEEAKLKPGEGAALVNSVMDEMPAAEAKIQQGDLILGVGDTPLPDEDPVGAVEDALAKAKGKVMLRVLRGGRVLRVTVKL